MKPQRLILGGMGLAGLAGWQRRGRFFKRAIAEYESVKRGDDTWLSIQFMKTMKVDRIAAGHLLDTFTDTTPEMLAALTMPTRSEERRVGKECVTTCRSRWSPLH